MKILVSFSIICLGLLGLAFWQFGTGSNDAAPDVETTGAARYSRQPRAADRPQSESPRPVDVPEIAKAEPSSPSPDKAWPIQSTIHQASKTQDFQTAVESESAIKWPGQDDRQRLKQRFRELRDMLVSDPHNQALMTAALELAYQLEWHNEACDLLTRLLRQNPEDPALRFKLATQLMRLERWLEALSNLKYVLRQQPENERALYNLAIAHQALGHLRDARLTWDRVLELAPENPDAHAHRGEIYLDLHDWSKAATDFERALELEPGASNYPQQISPCQMRVVQIMHLWQLLSFRSHLMSQRECESFH